MNTSPTPRFGYGVVASAFGVQAVSIGLSVAVFPVFVDALESGLGATRTQTSFGIPLVLLTGALAAPLAGRAVDRGSPRLVMIAGALMMMLGLVGIAFAPSLLWAAVAWMVLVGPGHTFVGPLPAITVIANWFVRRRATMIGVAAIGTTFGAAVAPPVANLLIGSAGWRAAVFWLGIGAAMLAIPTVLLGIRKSPQEVGSFPDGLAEPPPDEPGGSDGAGLREVLSNPGYWLVSCSFALIIGLGVAFLTHEIPFAMERGLPRELAVGLLSLSSVGSAMGKVLFGAIADRLGPRRAAYIGIALLMLGWSGLLVSTGPLTFAAAALVLALGMGANMPVQAAFVAALFGRASFGRASGLISLFTILGTFTLAPLIGAGFEATGSYDTPLTLSLGLLLLPPVLLSFVRVEHTKEPGLAEAARST
jgi:MFS family permease